MPNGQQAKEPGFLSPIQAFLGLVQLVIAILVAVANAPAEVKNVFCLTLFLIWLLVLLFDLWGWGARADVLVPGIPALAGAIILLLFSLIRFNGLVLGLPPWLKWVGWGLLEVWCLHEIFANLTHGPAGVPQLRFLDSGYSISVAACLLVATTLWVVVV